jgi:putative DNA primase/helicase
VQSLKEEFDRHDRAAQLQWEEAVRAHERDKNRPDPGRKPLAHDVSQKLVGDVSLAIQGEVYLGSNVAPHTWIDGEHAPTLLVAENGLADLEKLLSGKPDFLTPHTPRFFTTRQPLSFAVEVAEPPRPVEWHKFLSGLWPDDDQSVRCLQQWFGYCLTQDTAQHKALLLIGPPRSGKGTIARVLRQLLGEANVAFTTFATLGGRFGLEDLVDKTLAVISDARVIKRADEKTVAVERFLGITGEDPQPVDRKGLAVVTRKLPLRFMVMSNVLPDLQEESGALAGRFITLQMEKSWQGQEDRGLEKRLLAELPGIFRWACEGWRSLQQAGEFVQPESGHDLGEELKHLTSPVIQFIEECCLVGQDQWAPTSLLYEAWCKWSASRHQDPGTEEALVPKLKAAVPGLKKCRPRHEGGDRPRGYKGIGLRPR